MATPLQPKPSSAYQSIFAAALQVPHLPTLIQGEGLVVLQLDDACQLLNSFQNGGCNVVRQLLKGLIQEEDDGSHGFIVEQSLNLLSPRQLWTPAQGTVSSTLCLTVSLS